MREKLGLQRRYIFRKRKGGRKRPPKKVGVGLKRRVKLNERRLCWRLAWWKSSKKKDVSHLLELTGRFQYSDQRFSRIRAPCMASAAVGTEGEEDQMAWSSTRREQLTEEGRKFGRSLMKRKKSTGPTKHPCGTPRQAQKERLL